MPSRAHIGSLLVGRLHPTQNQLLALLDDPSLIVVDDRMTGEAVVGEEVFELLTEVNDAIEDLHTSTLVRQRLAGALAQYGTVARQELGHPLP